MAQLREKLPDPLVLQLIHRYLTAGVVLLDGRREETPEGVPPRRPALPVVVQYRARPVGLGTLASGGAVQRK